MDRLRTGRARADLSSPPLADAFSIRSRSEEFVHVEKGRMSRSRKMSSPDDGCDAAGIGARSAPAWQLVLNILWESGFRVGGLMGISWHDPRHIHREMRSGLRDEQTARFSTSSG